MAGKGPLFGLEPKQQLLKQMQEKLEAKKRQDQLDQIRAKREASEKLNEERKRENQRRKAEAKEHKDAPTPKRQKTESRDLQLELELEDWAKRNKDDSKTRMATAIVFALCSTQLENAAIHFTGPQPNDTKEQVFARVGQVFLLYLYALSEPSKSIHPVLPSKKEPKDLNAMEDPRSHLDDPISIQARILLRIIIDSRIANWTDRNFRVSAGLRLLFILDLTKHPEKSPRRQATQEMHFFFFGHKIEAKEFPAFTSTAQELQNALNFQEAKSTSIALRLVESYARHGRRQCEIIIEQLLRLKYWSVYWVLAVATCAEKSEAWVINRVLTSELLSGFDTGALCADWLEKQGLIGLLGAELLQGCTDWSLSMAEENKWLLPYEPDAGVIRSDHLKTTTNAERRVFQNMLTAGDLCPPGVSYVPGRTQPQFWRRLPYAPFWEREEEAAKEQKMDTGSSSSSSMDIDVTSHKAAMELLRQRAGIAGVHGRVRQGMVQFYHQLDVRCRECARHGSAEFVALQERHRRYQLFGDAEQSALFYKALYNLMPNGVHLQTALASRGPVLRLLSHLYPDFLFNTAGLNVRGTLLTPTSIELEHSYVGHNRYGAVGGPWQNWATLVPMSSCNNQLLELVNERKKQPDLPGLMCAVARFEGRYFVPRQREKEHVLINYYLTKDAVRTDNDNPDVNEALKVADQVHKANTRGRAIHWFEEVDATRVGIVDKFSMIGEGKKEKAADDDEFTRYLMAFVGADPIAEEKNVPRNYCVFTFTGIEDLLGAQYMMLYGTDFLKSYEADRIESMRKMLAEYEQHERPFDYRVVRYLETMHKKGLLDPPPTLEMRGIDATQEPVESKACNEAQKLADLVFQNKNSLGVARNPFLLDFLTQLARQQYKERHVHEPTLRDFEREEILKDVRFKKGGRVAIMAQRLTEDQPSNYLAKQAAIEKHQLAAVTLAKAKRENQRWAKKRDGPMPANGERIAQLHKALQEAKQAMDAEIKIAATEEIKREAIKELPMLMADDMKSYYVDEDRIETEGERAMRKLKKEEEAQRRGLLVQGINPDKNEFIAEAAVESDVDEAEEEEMGEAEAEMEAAVAMDLGGSSSSKEEKKEQRALGDAVSAIVDDLWYPQDIESRRAILARDPHPDTPVASWLQDQVVPHYAAVWHYLKNIPESKDTVHPEYRPRYVPQQPRNVEPWLAVWSWALRSDRVPLLWATWEDFVAAFKVEFWLKGPTPKDFYPFHESFDEFSEDRKRFYGRLMLEREVGAGIDTKATTKKESKKIKKAIAKDVRWTTITANPEEMGLPMQLLSKDGPLVVMLRLTLANPDKEAEAFIRSLSTACEQLNDRAMQMRFVVLLFDWCRCIFTMTRILQLKAQKERPYDPVLLGCIDECAEHAARLISGNGILRRHLTRHRELQMRAHLAMHRLDLKKVAEDQGISMDQLDWLFAKNPLPDNVVEALNGRNPRDLLEQDSVLKLLATGKRYRSPFAGFFVVFVCFFVLDLVVFVLWSQKLYYVGTAPFPTPFEPRTFVVRYYEDANEETYGRWSDKWKAVFDLDEVIRIHLRALEAFVMTDKQKYLDLKLAATSIERARQLKEDELPEVLQEQKAPTTTLPKYLRAFVVPLQQTIKELLAVRADFLEGKVDWTRVNSILVRAPQWSSDAPPSGEETEFARQHLETLFAALRKLLGNRPSIGWLHLGMRRAVKDEGKLATATEDRPVNCVPGHWLTEFLLCDLMTELHLKGEVQRNAASVADCKVAKVQLNELRGFSAPMVRYLFPAAEYLWHVNQETDMRAAATLDELKDLYTQADTDRLSNMGIAPDRLHVLEAQPPVTSETKDMDELTAHDLQVKFEDLASVPQAHLEILAATFVRVLWKRQIYTPALLFEPMPQALYADPVFVDPEQSMETFPYAAKSLKGNTYAEFIDETEEEVDIESWQPSKKLVRKEKKMDVLPDDASKVEQHLGELMGLVPQQQQEGESKRGGGHRLLFVGGEPQLPAAAASRQDEAAPVDESLVEHMVTGFRVLSLFERDSVRETDDASVF